MNDIEPCNAELAAIQHHPEVENGTAPAWLAAMGEADWRTEKQDRRAIGIELKPSYYRQAIKNLAHAETITEEDDQEAFEFAHAKDTQTWEDEPSYEDTVAEIGG